MTRIWKLEEAKTHLSQLIREAEREPQVISRHGKAVAVVTPVTEAPATGTPASSVTPASALEALLGDFDFSDFPEEDQFPRYSGPMRDLNL